MQRRYAHGPGADEPLVWYEGSGTSDRRWFHHDERGSVVALSNSAGSYIGINTYDEYGIPGASIIGRFGYTGQTWLPEVGMNYYKARMYSPSLGRFLQTDPAGYSDGMNLYAYVGGDPINGIDSSGSGRTSLNQLIKAGLVIRNKALAGKQHPVSKVWFDGRGFPVFKPHSLSNVYLTKGFKGKAADVKAANKEGGYTKTPPGYVWHHHQDGHTMQLVPAHLHTATGHTGGLAVTAAANKADASDLLAAIDPSMIAGLFSLPLELLLYSDGAAPECQGGDFWCAGDLVYAEGAGPFGDHGIKKAQQGPNMPDKPTPYGGMRHPD